MNPLAATNDPQTSHQAAAELVASGAHARQMEEAYALVVKYPDRTSMELASISKTLDRYQLARRLADLKERGRVRQGAARPCAVSGRTAVTWGLVQSKQGELF